MSHFQKRTAESGGSAFLLLLFFQRKDVMYTSLKCHVWYTILLFYYCCVWWQETASILYTKSDCVYL